MFLLFVARKARQECMMQVSISKVKHLVRENNVRLEISPTIGGNMTKVTYSYFKRTMKAACRVTHIIELILQSFEE